ncbi:hypothetical protein NKR23_g8991 [Pleurostoma richardsiae]|uniref:Nephrocystin 3-like N-terminal domain-containing protein n=1 Tax=Pleurostoma richardsiae TaxID=41990 RepID=A0AA38RPA4_9PEZI|nr:hypothetical protein NKR23_g8991 [Pleurostoma richardsiae]
MSLIRQFKLMGILRVEAQSVWDDIDSVFRKRNNVDESQLVRAAGLTQDSTFVSWLRASRSSILLVQGEFPPDSSTGITPLSVVGVECVMGLRTSELTVVLAFFGGLHCDERRTDGPKAMLRALIAQILLSDEIRTPSPDIMTAEDIEALQSRDIRGLCEKFEQLISSLPLTPLTSLFCILDGVGSYEQEPWRAELATVAEKFESLARKWNEDNRCFFKVLMLFPDRSLEVSQRIERDADIWSITSLRQDDDGERH